MIVGRVMTIRFRNKKTFEKLIATNPDISYQDDYVKRNQTSDQSTKKIFYEGKLFDSGMEYKRYKTLQLWEKAGMIRNLDTQHSDIGKPQALRKHRWELYPAYTRDGKKKKAVYYIDDFFYEIKCVDHWIPIVEDYKGFSRASFKMKWKILCGRYPHINFFLNFDLHGWYPDIERERWSKLTESKGSI